MSLNFQTESESGGGRLRDAIRRLCYFVPIEDKNLGISCHEHLIKQSMALGGLGRYTIQDIIKSIQGFFNLEFEEEEIELAIKGLLESGVIKLSGDEYLLNVEKKKEAEESLKDFLDFENKIKDQWINEIQKKHKNLNEREIDFLLNDLDMFLLKICERHGVECISLLYAEKTEIEEYLGDVSDDIFSMLPERSNKINNVRFAEFSAFFVNATTERKVYISRLLNNTFLIYMLHIDKECSALIRLHFEGTKIYLDTNFIYRLLGLHGELKQKAAIRGLEIAKELGFIFRVSIRTINEWEASRKNSKRIMERNNDFPPDVSKTVSGYVDNDFVKGYMRESAETGVSIDDYFELFMHIEGLLKEYGVVVSDYLCKDVENDPQLKNEISILNTATNNSKEPLKAEHDAFHRLLILKHRGGKKLNSFIDANAWFLTLDTILPKYDRIARKGSEGIPFCIQANQFIQLLRPLIPRTKDFDETFADLFTSPYIRVFGGVPVDIAMKILGRIKKYSCYSPEFVVKVLTNRHLTNQLKETDEEKEIDEIIDSAAAKAANDFEKERDFYKRELEKERLEKEKLGKELYEDKLRREKEGESIDSLIEQKNKEIYIISLEKEELKKVLLKKRKTHSWLKCIGLWFISSVIIISTLQKWGELNWCWKGFFLTVSIFAFLSGFIFLFGASKFWSIVSKIAVIITIVVCLFSLSKWFF